MHAVECPTLCQDWELRREYLRTTGAPVGQAYIDAQIRVLNFLLCRNRESSDANRPARFPMSAGLVFDHRAVLVHHHLEKGKASVKSEPEARARVSKILQRISAQDPQRDVKAPTARFRGTAVEGPPLNWSIFPSEIELQKIAWYKIVEALLWGTDASARMVEALRFGPALPEKAIAWLYNRIEARPGNVLETIDILSQCGNDSVLEYAALAWRDRIALKGPDNITRYLEVIFLQPSRRAKALERFRYELAHAHAEVRLEALKILAKIGTLDDVGLLSDLLSLKPLPDEAPGERDAVLNTMRTLAEITG